MSVLLTTPESPTPSIFAKRLPMAETFFAGALQGNRLAHAYVLKGKASGAMYNLALQVARVLNCSARPALAEGMPLEQMACGQCVNCRWTAQNSHPAVLTLSRMTFQINDKKERPDLLTAEELEKMAQKPAWPTQIKTDQVGLLIQHLALSSEHVRVVIFTDSEELPADSFPPDVPAPCEWRSLEATEGRAFHVRPLERSVFNDKSVNKFLKTLEEPPPNCLFFYIAETEEQLLDTIVSRCQVVPCAAENGAEAADESAAVPPECREFLETLLTRMQKDTDAFALAAEFETFFTQQAGFSLTQGIEMLQRYLRQRLLNRALEPAGFAMYREIQQSLETAIRMLASKTHESQSVLNLFLTLNPLLARL